MASIETKALGLALLAATLSLGGTLLLATPIRLYSSLRRTEASPPESAAVSSPAMIEQGREFFTMSCVECHGDDAHGDEGPDLHNLAISNSRIETTIRKGVKGEMPSFEKKYGPDQRAALLAYLRSLK